MKKRGVDRNGERREVEVGVEEFRVKESMVNDELNWEVEENKNHLIFVLSNPFDCSSPNVIDRTVFADSNRVSSIRSHRLGGPVLGYLTAGILTGPYGLSVIHNVHATEAIVEFGVGLNITTGGRPSGWPSRFYRGSIVASGIKRLEQVIHDESLELVFILYVSKGVGLGLVGLSSPNS
ncbi:hypothetical protein L1987_25060 [Smallanthus sonchifolius]|uniref:Uncharacterized protein n=1 Tax=Smallanthus sonchifolius TaxID=185202 RepID=A0ACB9ILY0_9ASTR|nr:hypothetical protein L1987_25060 [Smallanthus sonchifolius]